ncbi:MAG TPA: ABC transporter substrate-binding protein [Chloroflexota bacterium]|nr:ABC transporter substrate-binding protein [Chloroflexota bacterium]
MRTQRCRVVACLSVLWVAACTAATRPEAAPPAAPAAAAPAAAAPASPPPAETIRVTFASDSAVYAPHFIAIEKGYYQEEGIEMEMISAGGGAGTPALISGDVQYSTSAASSLSAMLKGAPLKVIYTNADRPGYELRSTSPDVRTLADLVGKSIGVHSRGDSNEVAARIVLQQQGVDPNAVTYTPLGGGSARLVAFESRAVAAVVLSTSDVVQLRDVLSNGHLLSDMRREVQMLYTGLATSDQELQQHRDRAMRFLRATVKGREYYKRYREETLQIMSKYNGDPREANEADYDDVLASMTEDGTMPVEAQRRDAQVRAEVNDVDQYPPVEQMYDYSLIKEIYRELQASGWQPTP